MVWPSLELWTLGNTVLRFYRLCLSGLQPMWINLWATCIHKVKKTSVWPGLDTIFFEHLKCILLACITVFQESIDCFAGVCYLYPSTSVRLVLNVREFFQSVRFSCYRFDWYHTLLLFDEDHCMDTCFGAVAEIKLMVYKFLVVLLLNYDMFDNW
jgi:hypothetical protein